MSRFIDLTGHRFGKLTVISRGENYHGSCTWNCECDCGKKKEIVAASLVSGHTKSCGKCKQPNEIESKKTYDRLYGIWYGIKWRCLNRNSVDYYLYGGRGITVCDEWTGEDGFKNFYKWSLDNGYYDELTIDRIDVNGNYEPSNCRWATYKEQANNKRNNRLLTCRGVTHTLSEWSSITGIKPRTIESRIYLYGWSEEKAITTPVRKKCVRGRERIRG